MTRTARIWHDAAVTASMLSPYRVLDLTDERGLLCGRILADLGADVLQVEPPAGNTARRLGPFYRDEPDPERSLYWWSYASQQAQHHPRIRPCRMAGRSSSAWCARRIS